MNMKRLLFTSFLIIQTCISIFAFQNVTVSGAAEVGIYKGLKMFYYEIEDGDLTLSYPTCSIRQGYTYASEIVAEGGWVIGNVTQNPLPYFSATFNPSKYLIKDGSSINSYFPDYPYRMIKLYNNYYVGDWESIYLRNTSPSTQTVCSMQSCSLFVATIAPQRWERSSDNGQTWTNLICNSANYTETNPSAGTYLYRALNGDGTYSSIKQVTYQDAVPSTVGITPATNTKTVGESITLGLDAADASYSYQWKKDGIVITGATSSTYSIPTILSANAGSYTCVLSNGCNSVTSTAAPLTVNKATQVITFPDIPAKTYGDAAFTLAATTDMGQTITYQSTNTTVATVSGNTVTILSPGTTNIIASQSGNADYLGATGVTKVLTVNKIAQTITFGAIAAKTYGGSTFTLPSTTDKGLTIAYTSTNTNVATVSGNTVTILTAGSTDLVANQSGNTNYYAAPTVSQTLTVNKAAQTITFGAFATKTFGDASISLNLNTDKNLPITYTSDNTAVVSTTGNVLTINKVGTANITSTQSGNTNYLAATPVVQSIVINKADQSIVWSNIANKTFSDADFTLPATTSKGLTISYQSADPTIASVVGNTVSIKGVGTVNITANQAGNENYNAAANVTLPLTISKSYQTITFSDLPAYTFGSSAVTLGASSNSGLAVTYATSDANIASVVGNTLTINNAGQCYITASAAGDANHFSATPIQKLVTVNKANQIVSFDVITDKVYGDGAFTLSAAASTSLPVTFSSSTPTKLIISGNSATIAGTGVYTITATQSGTSNYNVATATRTVTVNKATLTVTADNKSRLYGDANPILTISYSGFVNGDTKYELVSIPTASTTGIITSTVADYPITIGAITDLNYSLVYRSGILTITQAPLMVTAQSTSKNFGDANPTFTLAYTGFKNSQTSSVLTTLPAATTSAKIMTNFGVYDILASGGTAQNYALSYTNGQLTINKATLKVFATDATRNYGDANPTFNMNISGFKGADDTSTLTTLPTVNCSATTTSNAGLYDISYAGATADNYLFDYASTVGKLTISKSPLAVQADNLSKEYGNLNPQLTTTYSGFKNNETASVLSVLPTVTTTALTTSNVGTYDISVSGGSSTNYSLSYTGAKLAITKAPLNISVKNDSIKKGVVPTFTLLYNGFKNNDKETVLSLLPTINCTATSTSPIGNYDIVLQGGLDKNYEYSLTNGVLKIVQSTGIEDVNLYNTSIYPIPSKDKIFIKSDLQISKVEILSIYGEVVLRNVGNDMSSIDISTLNGGSYFIRLFGDNAIVTRMIIKY